MNQRAFTSASCGHALNAVKRLGATTYRPTPVATSTTARVPQRRTSVPASSLTTGLRSQAVPICLASAQMTSTSMAMMSIAQKG